MSALLYLFVLFLSASSYAYGKPNFIVMVMDDVSIDYTQHGTPLAQRFTFAISRPSDMSEK
jgi:hypothetical protein